MATHAATARRSFLDTIWARLIALLIAAAALAILYDANRALVDGWLNRSDAAPTVYDACLSERLMAVDKMAGEAGFTTKQRELAEIRAAETCRNQTGG